MPANDKDKKEKDPLRDRLPITDALKAVKETGGFFAKGMKKIWDWKPPGGVVGRILAAPFKAIAMAGTAAVGTVASAAVIATTAVTHGVIKGTYDVAKGVGKTLYGAGQIAGGIITRNGERIKSGAKNFAGGIVDITKGVTKVAVGAAIAGSMVIAVGSGVGIPALAGVGAAAAGAVQAVPFIGTALSTGVNVVAGGAALAGTQVAAGLGAAAAGASAAAGATVAATATVGSTVLAPLAAAGVTVGSTATLAVGAGAVGLGAAATLRGIDKIDKKISGNKSTKAELSDLKNNSSANVQQPATSQASNDTVKPEGITLTAIGKQLQSVQQQSEQQKITPPVSDVVQSASATAPQANRELETTSKVELSNEQLNKIRDSLPDTSTTFNYDTDKKPTFIGRDPVAAAAAVAKAVPALAEQTWTLKVKEGTSEERINALLSKAEGLTIGKVKIGDVVREVQDGKMTPLTRQADVAPDAAPAADANAAPVPQDESEGTNLTVRTGLK